LFFSPKQETQYKKRLGQKKIWCSLHKNYLLFIITCIKKIGVKQFFHPYTIVVSFHVLLTNYVVNFAGECFRILFGQEFCNTYVGGVASNVGYSFEFLECKMLQDVKPNS